MVAEPWVVKMGNQVSANLKHALLSQPSSTGKSASAAKHRRPIGILSFEVTNVLSKTVHLHKSLTDSEISKLRNEILKSEGIANLVSSDEGFLLELALAEKLDELNRVAAVVSRLGKRCVEPALQGFEHVFGDIVNGVIDVRELGFLVKDMEGTVRKMERYVTSTANLYREMEVLNELEQAAKKFQHNQHEESRRAFEQKLMWQRQDVRPLKEVSLWSQSYDKVVELLARSVCTIFSRLCLVFGDSALRGNAVVRSCDSVSPSRKEEFQQVMGQRYEQDQVVSGKLRRVLSKSSSGLRSEHLKGGTNTMEKRGVNLKPQSFYRKTEPVVSRAEDFRLPCGASTGRLFMDCLSFSSSASRLDYDEEDDNITHDDRSSQISGCCSVTNDGRKGQHLVSSPPFCQVQSGVPFGGEPRQSNYVAENNSIFGTKSRLTAYSSPSTVGGSALALHYANIIIVIEKLLRYPHLVGEEARDDLYHMLPSSLRVSLRTNLKSYVKNLAIYDAPLAHDWKENLDGVLGWLAPLAHNMVRWQSERNFEQQQIVTKTNVLLLQTLYFADRQKTEAAICELLIGLNYICRYEHQQNVLLDCASSFDFEDCMEWQLQYGASFLN